MRRFKAIVPMCLAVMGLLAGGLVMSPQAKAQPSPLWQDEPKPKTITISGIAVLPDGGVAADLSVEIKEPLDVFVERGSDRPPPDKLPEFRFKTLAKGTTDAAGRFALEFERTAAKALQLDIGKKTESAWIIKPVMHQGKDVDLGKVPL